VKEKGMKSSSSPSVAGPDAAKVQASLPSFDFQPATRVVFGVGSLARIGELALELGGHRALLVTDPGLEAVGHPQQALANLRLAGLDAWIFDAVEENPTTRHVQAGLEKARELQIDLLVAVGGGSSMDCAKGINFLYTNGGSMADYRGFGKATKPMLPSIGVPTTAGTGSEGQSFALVADDQTHMKMACGDRKAAFRVAVLDPAVTVSQPAKVTAITGIDALSHAVESFVCTRRSAVSQMFGKAAWGLLSSHFKTVLREPGNLQARGSMQIGANLSGAAIENSMLGACHACANPLTAHFGITHGVAIAIMLPHVIRFNAEAVSDLYADLLGEVETNGSALQAAHRLAAQVSDFARAASLPETLLACGVKPAMLPLLAAEASEQWTARFNPRPVETGDFLRLYQVAL
jgi:alcohol dehydrogenase